MSRKQSRATRKGGFVIRTQTITNTFTGEHYWFELPEGTTWEDWSVPRHIPRGVTTHGPFKTHEEVDESQRLVLLGPQCKVTEGGEWDPAWDRPQ
jgi:hypothetical protein